MNETSTSIYQGGNCEIDGKSDTQDFKALLSAMQVLGFTSEEQDTIFKILASVLHLGNVYFHRKQMRHGQEGVEVGSDAEIRWAAHLLQVNSDGIIRALTTKTTVGRFKGINRSTLSRTSRYPCQRIIERYCRNYWVVDR